MIHRGIFQVPVYLIKYQIPGLVKVKEGGMSCLETIEMKGRD